MWGWDGVRVGVGWGEGGGGLGVWVGWVCGWGLEEAIAPQTFWACYFASNKSRTVIIICY